MAKLLAGTTIGDKRYLHVYLDVGGISETRYYKIATINRVAGIVQVNGILGGHIQVEGRGLVNIAFAMREQPAAWGALYGSLNRSNLILFVPTDTSLPGEVWIEITTWGLVNLEVSAVGVVSIVYDGSYATSPPSGGSIYSLKQGDFSGVIAFPYLGIGGSVTIS